MKIENNPSELYIFLRQILVAIRGAWTQEEMSERLGYSALQVHRWENLKIHLSWSDFVRICSLRKTPLQTAFEKFYAYKGTPSNSTVILNLIRAGMPQKDIVQNTGITSSRLSKILNGHQEPDAFEVLLLMRTCQSWFWEFWAEVVKPEKVPMLKNEIDKRTRHIELSVRFPFAAALLESLRLREYKTSTLETAQFLSEALQIPIADLKIALIALQETGIIEKLPDGKYQAHNLDVNLGRDFQNAKVIMEYWMQRHLVLLKKTKKKFPESFFSYMTVPLSKNAFNETRQLFLELYQKIVLISKSDQGQDKAIYTYTTGFVRTDEKPRP